MIALLSVSDALQRMLDAVNPVGSTEVPLDDACGRVLAQDIESQLDLPLFTNSSMDGFAVRVSDVESASPDNPAVLDVVGDVPAGKLPERTIEAGQAARIMTGAVLPDGADGVVPVEDTSFNERRAVLSLPASVEVYRPIRRGENLRPRGQDVYAGQIILRKGQNLRPQDVGFLAMIGRARVGVFRKPRVAFFSTGDELISLGTTLQAGKLYDSNAYTLSAQVRQYGGEAIYLGIAKDREDEVQRCLDSAADLSVDLIISSAGVSVGAFDFVRNVVEHRGKLDFWRVNMRPGKPLVFGEYGQIPFIGLPGNPVSAYVGVEVFVRPILAKMGGAGYLPRPTQRVILLEDIESDGRESYLRAIVTGEDSRLVARLTGHQGSGNLHSLVQANALLIVPSGVKSLPAGSEAEAWLLDI